MIFLLPLGVVIAAALAWAASLLIHSDLSHRHMNFVIERTSGGADPDDVAKELQLRMAAARLRRRATHEVLQRPTAYVEIIRSAAKSEGLRLAALDKRMARKFIHWAEGADLSEILYPVAMRAIWKARGKLRHTLPHSHHAHDLHAALRTID